MSEQRAPSNEQETRVYVKGAEVFEISRDGCDVISSVDRGAPNRITHESPRRAKRIFYGMCKLKKEHGFERFEGAIEDVPLPQPVVKREDRVHFVKRDAEGEAVSLAEVSRGNYGYQVTVRRVAGTPIERVATVRDQQELTAAIDAEIKKLISDGYVEDDEGPVEIVGNEALELAVAAARDDEDAWGVYADWLEQQGDPRAPFVSGASSAAEFERLRALSEPTWLGELFDATRSPDVELDYANEGVPQLTLRYSRGVVDAASIWGFRDSDYDTPESRLALFLDLPITRLLRVLNIAAWTEFKFQSVYSVIQEHAPKSIEELTIGDFEYPDDTEISWAEVGAVGSVLPSLPNLRRLRTMGAKVGLGRLEHDALRSLRVESGGCGEPCAVSVANARLPMLEKLELWLGSRQYDGFGSIAQLQPLFDGENYPSLSILRLRNCDAADEIAERICDAEIVKQLGTLDLSLGALTDDGARCILKHHQRFAHLRRFVINRTYVSQDVISELSAVFGEALRANHMRQRNEYEDEVYSAVGE